MYILEDNSLGRDMTLTDSLNVKNSFVANQTGILINSTTTMNANFSFDGSFINSAIVDGFVDGSLITTYSTTANSDTTGILDVSNTSVFLLDFSNFDDQSETNTIETIQFPAAVNGQILLIIAKIGSSGGTHTIVDTNFGNLATGDTIQFNADYDSLYVIGVDDVWVYRGLTGATYVAAP